MNLALYHMLRHTGRIRTWKSGHGASFDADPRLRNPLSAARTCQKMPLVQNE
jgi:hypothetical protein